MAGGVEKYFEISVAGANKEFVAKVPFLKGGVKHNNVSDNLLQIYVKDTLTLANVQSATPKLTKTPQKSVKVKQMSYEDWSVATAHAG